MATFIANNNRDKGNVYLKALKSAGHIQINDFNADFLFFDHERPGIATQINTALGRGKPVFIYPHSAIADILWDGMYYPLKITRNIMPGEGQKEVMRLYGYPNEVEVCGWPYGEVKPFKVTSGKKLLFAPIHPNSAGRKMRNEDKENNRKTMQLILDNKDMFESITLRFGGSLLDNGLREFWQAPIIFEKSIYHIDHSLESINKADIVISFGTFGYLSVAEGKPTVFYGQNMIPHNISRTVKNFDKYKKYRRFPFDTDLCADLPFKNLIKMAYMEQHKEVEDWKSRFIGTQFDSKKFISIIESFL